MKVTYNKEQVKKWLIDMDEYMEQETYYINKFKYYLEHNELNMSYWYDTVKEYGYFKPEFD